MGKKQRTSYRMNISLPADLKKRMDKASEQVNWSALACRAFEEKLSEIETKKERKNVSNEVVKRLQEAAAADTADDYEAGKEAGRKWAERQATPKELRRIADYIERNERETSGAAWWNVDYPGWYAPFGATDNFVFAARPARKDDRDADEEFWQEALGEDAAHRVQDADFFHGFGDGVAEVWNEVRGQL